VQTANPLDNRENRFAALISIELERHMRQPSALWATALTLLKPNKHW
jgi:hypothetical protein